MAWRNAAPAMLAGLILILSAVTGPAAAAPQMTVPGQFAVSPTGAATYSIPIIAPPGTAGMAPVLSLDYSSQAQDGIVGWQWSLDGLSSIGRCPRTLAQDGIHGSVNFDANDRFCLNGQRLILVGGTYGADGSEYRTEIETFARVVAHGSAGTGPAYFDVYTKSGTTLELGNTTDSRLLAVGTTTARAWAVDKISDTKGNYLTVTYTNDATNGQIYPARIDYTGNAAASLATYNSVQFTYNTSRPDVTPSYQAGSRQQGTVLLTDIKTFNGASVVYDYKLAYRLGSATTRSRLTSVTLCDGTGTNCLAPTTFGWQGGTGQLSMTATANGLFQGFSVLPLDYNGDGLTDAIEWGPSSCPSYDVYAGTPSGLSFASLITSSTLPVGSLCTPSGQQSIDIEPDGNSDVLLSYFYETTGRFPIPTHNQYVLKSDGTYFSTAFTLAGSATVFAGDFNGDGRADFFALHTADPSFIYFGDGTGSFTPDAGHTGFAGQSVSAADFDGDGCTDLLSLGTTNSVVYSCNPAVATASPPASSGYSFILGDFNGDGKTDILATSATGTGTLYLSTGTGFAATSFTVPTGWSKYTIYTADVNGDGKSDLILVASGATGMYGSGTPHQIWLSTGTGFVQAVDTSNNPISIANSDTSVSATVADWNNDGAADFLLKKASGDTRYTFAYVPELMTSVSNGIGATTTVTYDRLNKNGTFYSKGSPGSYPIVPIDAAVYVVSQVSSSNGIGGNFSWTYAYGGAFGNVNTYSAVSIASGSRTMFGGAPAFVSAINTGSPLVGFTQVTITDAQTHIVTTTSYRPDFPYTGLIASQTSVHGTTTLSSSTNTWSATNLGGTHNFVFLQQSAAAGNDLDGTALPTTTTSYTYDAYGNATQINRTVSAGGTTSSTSDTTNTFSNDTTNWLFLLTGTATTNVKGSSTITRTTSYGYQSGTNVLNAVTIEPGSTTLERDIAFTLDAFGNRTKITTSTPITTTGITFAARSVSVGYDTQGRFATSVSDPYAAGGSPSLSQTFTYSAAFGSPLTRTDQNSLVTTLTYDTLGRRTQVSRPDGTYTTYGYTTCAGSCPTGAAYYTTTTPRASGGGQNGPSLTQYYDVLNRPIQSTADGFGGSITQTAAYDAAGRQASVSRPYTSSPVYTTFVYDDLGRVHTATAPNGGVTTYAYSGLTTTVTDALTRTTTTTLNAEGNVASVTDAASHATSYAYDAFGDLLGVTDPSGNTIANTFDKRGHKLSSADPDMGSWSYVYDARGELTRQTDAKSQVTTLAYDLQGRLVSRTEPDLTSTWSYGTTAPQADRLVSENAIGAAGLSSGGGFTRAIGYDSLSRPNGSSATFASGGTDSYAVTYNGDGRIDTVTYPSGFVAKYVYTATTGYLSQIKDNASGSVLYTVNTRDAEMHLTQGTSGNGVAETDTFDADTGLLTDVRAGPSNSVAQLDFGYDTLGNLTSRSDDLEGVFEKFCYDSLNRLTNSATAQGTGPSTCTSTGTGITSKTIGYDALGNITSKSDVGSYSYPSAGSTRPHAVSSITGTVNGVTNPTYAYDGNGNLTAGAGFTATQSSFNMALAVVQGTTSVSYVYGPEHERIQRIASAGSSHVTTRYESDPVSGAVEENDTTDGIWKDFLAVDGQVVAERSCTGTAPCTTGSTWTYFTADHLGSTAVLTNASGTVTERDSYDAWGRRRNTNGTDNASCGITSATDVGYTGHEQMDSVCQVNTNARLYDPTIGRFMSPDSMVPDPTDGESFNRYSYVENNPLSATDPSGHDPQRPCYGCYGPDIESDANGQMENIADEAKYREFAQDNQFTFTVGGHSMTCSTPSDCQNAWEWALSQDPSATQVNVDFPQIGVQLTETAGTLAAGDYGSFDAATNTTVVNGARYNWTQSALGANGALAIPVTGFVLNGGVPFDVDDNNGLYKLGQRLFKTAPLKGSALKADLYHALANQFRTNAIENGQYFLTPSNNALGYSLLLQMDVTPPGTQGGIVEYLYDFSQGAITHQTFIPDVPVSGYPNNWNGIYPPFIAGPHT